MTADTAAAIEVLDEDGGVDLVVSSLTIGDGDAAQLASSLREAGHDGPTEAVFGPDAMTALAAHRWPGNVRELRNVIERAVVLSNERQLKLPGPLGDGGDAPAAGAAGSSPLDSGRTLDELLDAHKIALVEEALTRSDGNHRKAAELLGIHRSSLTRMIHRLGVGSDSGGAT